VVSRSSVRTLTIVQSWRIVGFIFIGASAPLAALALAIFLGAAGSFIYPQGIPTSRMYC